MDVVGGLDFFGVSSAEQFAAACFLLRPSLVLDFGCVFWFFLALKLASWGVKQGYWARYSQQFRGANYGDARTASCCWGWSILDNFCENLLAFGLAT